MYNTITNIFFLSLHCSNAYESEILQRQFWHSFALCNEKTEDQKLGWGGLGGQVSSVVLNFFTEVWRTLKWNPTNTIIRKAHKKLMLMSWSMIWYRWSGSICEYSLRSLFWLLTKICRSARNLNHVHYLMYMTKSEKYFRDRVSLYSADWIRTPCIDQAVLKLIEIYLPKPPKNWD